MLTFLAIPLLVLVPDPASPGAAGISRGPTLVETPRSVPLGNGLGVTNLGLAVTAMEADDTVLAFLVEEGQQGISLNDDDDLADRVLHVFDARSGEVRNLRVGIYQSRFDVYERQVGFLRDEPADGVDLDGDGDTLDRVFGAYDAARGTLANLALASPSSTQARLSGYSYLFPRTAGCSFVVSGGALALVVDEGDQGGLDRNGDGDADDTVLDVGLLARAGSFDDDRAVPLYPRRNSLGPGTTVVRYVSTPQLVAVQARESEEGVDLNGDGDLLDDVAGVLLAPRFRPRNLGLDVRNLYAVGGLVVVEVEEADQGGTDLNGDGDATDHVPHVFDAATGTILNTGLAGGIQSMTDTRFLIDVFESRQGGTDLNGDGDAQDGVVHLVDTGTGTTVNLGVTDRWTAIVGDMVFTAVDERTQGFQDLNGDGDVADYVLFSYDIASGVSTNHGLALDINSLPFAIHSLESDRAIFVHASEARQGNTDLNGNGTANDLVAFYFDLDTRTLVNTGLASTLLLTNSNRALVRVPEASQGLDLNGDGDLLDQVLHLVDATSGVVTNLGLAHAMIVGEPVPAPVLRPGFAAIPVFEKDQGGIDLNGNGTTGNQVLHVVRIP